MKKQMTDPMLWDEKVAEPGEVTAPQEECYEAVTSIAERINMGDPDMRSHVIMSIFMVGRPEFAFF